uniref:Nucleolar protein 12 n=1 Tax=Culex tarsalis TaxID=7177 RepID=A0A1Q3EX37_CULTA
MKRKSQDGNRPGAGAKRKTELVFDPNKRAEFLTGFHKRKLHRKKIAQGQLERKLKEETRRIRTEAKENKKKLYHSYKPIPELTQEDREDPQEEQEYDTENVTVKVVELSTKELAKQNNWIGENHAMVRGDEDDESDEEGQQSSEDDDEDAVDTIPGMELDASSRKNKLKLDGENDEQPEEPPAKKPHQQRGPVLNLEGIRSKKEMKHKLKRHALKSLKNSKAYQQTVRAQQQKQLKKSRRVRHVREKKLKRQGKLPASSGDGGRAGGKGGKRRGGRD